MVLTTDTITIASKFLASLISVQLIYT